MFVLRVWKQRNIIVFEDRKLELQNWKLSFVSNIWLQVKVFGEGCPRVLLALMEWLGPG